MTADGFGRVGKLFLQARELEGEAREQLLDEACEGDEELRREVVSLLAHEAVGEKLLDPAVVGQLAADALEDRPEVALPSEIGRYRVLGLLGQGGMGSVYLAEQESPARRVAVKVVRSGLGSRDVARRFQLEASVLGRLKAPGIAQIFEAGVANLMIPGEAPTPCPFFAMELVEGIPPTEFMVEEQLDRQERLELFARICDAVEHAHEQGIVHRDLKPGNILVEASGQPKVLDFGVARVLHEDERSIVTMPGAVIGTLAYMSPEQVAGADDDLDVRSDVYSLGALLYEMLAGRRAHDLGSESLASAALRIRDEEPPLLGAIDRRLRGDVETMVCRAMAKEPDRRYASAGALAADIRRFLAHQPILARRPSGLYRARRFVRRHPGLVLGLTLAFVVLSVALVVTLRLAARERESARIARDNEVAALRAGYQGSIVTAAAFLETENYPQAARALASAPPAERGWEHGVLTTMLEAGRETGELPGGCRALARDATGQLIAAVVTSDGELQIVGLPGLEVRHRWAVGPAVQVGLTSDGRICFVGDGSSITRVNLASGERREAVRKEARLLLLSVDATGERLVASHRERMFVLDGLTGETLASWKLGGSRLSGGPGVYVFSPAGDRLLAADLRSPSRTRLRVVPSLGGEPLAWTSLDERVTGACWHPDGSRVAVSLAFGRVLVLRASDGEILWERRRAVAAGEAQVHQALAFSADGSQLILGGVPAVEVRDVASGDLQWSLHSAHGAKSLLVDAIGSEIVWARGRTFTRAALQPERLRVLSGHDRYLQALAFSPDGRVLASSAYSPRVHLWDTRTGERIASKALTGFKGPPRFLTYSRDGRGLLVGRGEAHVRLFDPQTLEAGQGTDVDLSRFSTFSSAYWGPQRRLIHGWTGRTTAVISGGDVKIRGPSGEVPLDTSGRVASACFSPRDDHLLLASGTEGELELWSLEDSPQVVPLTQVMGTQVLALAWSPDGSRIAAGCRDGQVHILRAENLEVIVALSGHSSYVSVLAWSADGTQLASGSADTTVRIWDSVSTPRDE